MEVPEEKIRWPSVLILAGYVAAHLAFTAILMGFGQGVLIPTEVCLSATGQQAPLVMVRPTHPAVIALLVTPMVAFSPMSLLSDLLVVRSIKKVFPSDDEKAGDATMKDEDDALVIPVRATVLSALTMLPYIVIIARSYILRSLSEVV